MLKKIVTFFLMLVFVHYAHSGEQSGTVDNVSALLHMPNAEVVTENRAISQVSPVIALTVSSSFKSYHNDASDVSRTSSVVFHTTPPNGDINKALDSLASLNQSSDNIDQVVRYNLNNNVQQYVATKPANGTFNKVSGSLVLPNQSSDNIVQVVPYDLNDNVQQQGSVIHMSSKDVKKPGILESIQNSDIPFVDSEYSDKDAHSGNKPSILPDDLDADHETKEETIHVPVAISTPSAQQTAQQNSVAARPLNGISLKKKFTNKNHKLSVPATKTYCGCCWE